MLLAILNLAVPRILFISKFHLVLSNIYFFAYFRTPTLDFEIGRGAIEGKFTTIEGLFDDIKKTVEKNPFTTGDSAFGKAKENIINFTNKIDSIVAGKLPCKLVLDDPTGNSYLQNPNAPDEDPQVEVTKYERTFEQNEDLGLNDMVVEGYN